MFENFKASHAKISLALIFLITLFSTAFAKTPVTLKLSEGSESMEIGNLLHLLGASQVTATIYADSIDAKFYAILMVNCKGNESIRTLIGYRFIEPGSTKFTVTAMPMDSLNLSICVSNASTLRQTVQAPTANRTLIGCNVNREFSATDTIPLMAYTTGIPTKFDLGNGATVEGWYICGLRNSTEHPSRWKELYNIPDYIYFEAIPVKEIELAQ